MGLKLMIYNITFKDMSGTVFQILITVIIDLSVEQNKKLSSFKGSDSEDSYTPITTVSVKTVI